jgi:hypothetical protein
MTYTRFMDMHSGGGLKEGSYQHIIIEAPEEEAKVIFYNRLGHNPERVTCTCCGDDYSISEYETLTEATAYDRNADSAFFYVDDGTEACSGRTRTKYDYKTKKHTYKGREVEFKYVERPSMEYMQYGSSKQDCIDRYKTIKEYLDSDEVLMIYDEYIKPDERRGSVPESGYVWVD